jgi:hypothetical protein
MATKTKNLNICKLYREPSGDILAVFPNIIEIESMKAMQCFDLKTSHNSTTKEYLKTCKRVKPDAEDAKDLVSYLLNGYPINYHCDKPEII